MKGVEFILEKAYIKIPGIFKKLKKAEAENAILYIHALGGYGKTAAVKYYLRRKSHLFLSGLNGMLENMPEINSIKQSVVVIDDISPIVDEASQEYICELMMNSNKQLILIGRTPLPKWIHPEKMDRWILSASENDLLMDAELTRKLLMSYNVDVTTIEAEEISKMTTGHPVTIAMVAQRMADRNIFDNEVIEQVKLDLYAYCDHAFYDTWDDELKNTLFPMAPFDSFTVRMIELVTGYSNVEKTIAKALTVSQALICDGKGNYQLKPVLRDYLRHKQKTTLSKNQRDTIYNNAGLYYELEDNIEQALACYDKTNNQAKIADLLIKNAMLHPGNGHYFETRYYYLKLDNEIIEASPILLAGLCMLHSLLMQTQHSEEWYDKLKQYAENNENTTLQRKDAKTRLAYLDIALPHRGSTKISSILKNVAILCSHSSIKMPEFSVTSNMPSVMNGGKDFCEWSNNSLEIARMLKVPVELVLGSFAVGLVNTSLAESAFEKDARDAYEIMAMLNSAYAKADTKGKPEMCFAAIGIMARVHLSRRQPLLAYTLVEDFYKKMELSGQNQLLPNIKTFYIWLELLNGKVLTAKKWLEEEAPNENLDFNILERYRYLIKIKTYIALGRLEEAINLTERLSIYCEEYERNLLQIEISLIRSILQYRIKLGDWQESLEKGLQKAYQYDFVRVIAEYGIALVPLLEEAKNLDIDQSYLKKITSYVKTMAENYPSYLVPLTTLKEPLTDTEKRILALLCTNANLEEIGTICDISYNTVRYHNKNIYRKLGVENRSQAKLLAKQLGLEAS